MKQATRRVETVYIVHNTSSQPTAHSERTMSNICLVFFHHSNPTDPYPTCTSFDDESKFQFTCVCVSDTHRPRSSRSCVRRLGASGKRGEISHSKGVGPLQNRPKSQPIDFEVYGKPTDTKSPRSTNPSTSNGRCGPDVSVLRLILVAQSSIAI